MGNGKYTSRKISVPYKGLEGSAMAEPLSSTGDHSLDVKWEQNQEFLMSSSSAKRRYRIGNSISGSTSELVFTTH